MLPLFREHPRNRKTVYMTTTTEANGDATPLENT